MLPKRKISDVSSVNRNVKKLRREKIILHNSLHMCAYIYLSECMSLFTEVGLEQTFLQNMFVSHHPFQHVHHTDWFSWPLYTVVKCGLDV
jgi:hypothetical protein